MRDLDSNCGIMGILNLTPDSFSGNDWGKTPERFSEDVRMMLESGASCVDVGAESTRPGAAPVSPTDEWARLAPYVSHLRSSGLIKKISFDTRHPDTMLQVAAAGCFAINCVGEIPDAATLSELKRSNQDLRFIACHMRGTPETMQKTPLRAAEVMDDVMGYFKAAMTALLNAGFRRESVWLDPGIGFGKTDAANTTLILGAAKLRSSGKLVWGVSRKGFLGRAFGIPEAKSRDAVSKVLESILALGGADMIRTHDVAGLHSALRALTAEA